MKYLVRAFICLLLGIAAVWAKDENRQTLHSWTNLAGAVIEAGFVAATDETVTLVMSGKNYEVPLASLSPESQSLAAKLAERPKGKDRKTERRNRKKKDEEVVSGELPPLAEIANAPKVPVNLNLRLGDADVTRAAAWIDHYVGLGLKKAGKQPNSPASDNVFVRRAYLDVVGRIPTDGETLAFVESKDPGKRAALIDDLLVSDGYAVAVVRAAATTDDDHGVCGGGAATNDGPFHVTSLVRSLLLRHERRPGR